MTDEFTLTIHDNGEPRDFNARLLLQGYTHKFRVMVNETEIFFEPDDEGHYRAIKMPWQEQKQIEKIDKNVLRAIALEIEVILA